MARMSFSTNFVTIIVLLFSTIPLHFVQTAKILFLIPMSTTSEKHFFEPLILQLASGSLGHNLTVVTNIPSPTPHPNITEIVPISVAEVFGKVTDVGLISDLFWDLIFWDMTRYVGSLDKIYSHPDFQPVMSQKYDLIFTNTFFGQAFYGLIYQNGGPFILLHSFSVSNYFLKDWGLWAPPSHIPYPLLDFTDQMGFWERVVNFLMDWAVYIQVEWCQIPLFEDVYRRHLGAGLPSVKEIQRNGSLLMTNTHFLSTYHRPLMPDVVEIGGLHCRKAKPLLKDLEDFVGKEAAPHGFILFSFGTVVPGSSLPVEIRHKFLRVFSRLKERVLWKFEDEEQTLVINKDGTAEPLPDNVLLKKWFPQQDILGHNNIRLFISHGGLLSTQQILCHGVPFLMFPFFFDQKTNANGAAKQGAGLVMNIWNFTESDLETAINRLLHEPQFGNRAKVLSEIFEDQITSPMERAIYWTEHVLKWDGAPHLRSSARDLNVFQFHSMDVIAFLLTCFAAGVLLLFVIVRTIFICLWTLRGRKKHIAKEKGS